MKHLITICGSLLIIMNGILAQPGTYKVDALVSPKKTAKIITVGGENADIHGFTNTAIQVAVDALPEEGGTVKLEPGVFIMKAPVKMRSDMILSGSGPGTVLKRTDGYHSPFILDADYGELKITVEDASGFEPGMSFQITNDPYSSCWDVTTGTITDIVGKVLYIDTYLVRDYDCEQNGMVTNAGSCVEALGIQNSVISDLTIDGNKDKNDLLDGCNGGGVAILKSRDVTVKNVHVHDFNGEGITWQITENVSVIDCEINGCTNMGLHPGTGSPNSLIEGNNSHDNRVGLFICWRVSHSLVKDNTFHNNLDCGISTGHKDTDVTFDSNHIFENGNDGVFFREEDEKNSPHNNIFVNNIVENNGRYGFCFNSLAREVVLKNNIIRDNQKGSQKAAVFLSKQSPPVKLEDNVVEGRGQVEILKE